MTLCVATQHQVYSTAKINMILPRCTLRLLAQRHDLAYFKAFLEPKGLYHYDATPVPIALLRVARDCCSVEESLTQTLTTNLSVTY